MARTKLDLSRVDSQDYRVVKEMVGGSPVFTIRLVFYDKGGDPLMLSEEPTVSRGNSMKELKYALDHQMKALEKPELDMAAFEE